MISEILNSFALTMNYLRRLVGDVPDAQMTCQPAGAANHPAWVIGHLVHSCEGMGSELDVPPWLPEDWTSRFGYGSVPSADRRLYPSKTELLRALDDGQRRLSEALAAIDESRLAGPLPDEARAIFPTLGHAVLHILGAHAAVHVGQVSVWRRVMGLQPLTQPFP